MTVPADRGSAGIFAIRQALPAGASHRIARWLPCHTAAAGSARRAESRSKRSGGGSRPRCSPERLKRF